MKSTCLLCSLQRMHDGWSKLISNFQPPIKAAPQQLDVRTWKAHFKFSRVCTAACEDFLRRNAWRNFRGFRHRVWSMFESPQRTTLEDQQQSSQFVCGARCTTVNGTEFEFHAIPRKLRDRATLKIDSGEKSFPLEVANQVARYF